MKLSWGIAASTLCSTVLAARPTVSPETARLIIAQRLGLSRFHSIEHADDEALRHINTYGGRQQKLFGTDDGDASKAHLLVWMENSEQDQATVAVTDDGRKVEFALDGIPSGADNDRLVEDIMAQARSLPKLSDPQQKTYAATFSIDAMLPKQGLTRCNDYLMVWRVNESDVIKQAMVSGADLFTGDFSATVVSIPAAGSRTKRTTGSWGTYASPSKDTRRENPEAFLSLNAAPSTSPKPEVSDLEDFPIIAAQSSDKGPVRGILPSCFASMSACQKSTNNCSSHGECKLLHKARGKGKDQESLDCFGCACVPTIKKVGKDSKTVTHWGGPACQKRDISIQFWLFVGVGLILSFLVASGIGMLFSMGSEELPSVIGAGVSGPVARK